MAPTPGQTFKTQRVLACVLCQQRKVKCDRRFPCANCTKAQVQCIPGTLAQRRRKRRFPERELLERLRKYESLLRQNNIKFDPLHPDANKEPGIGQVDSEHDSEDEHPQTMELDPSTPSASTKSERAYEVKNVWHAMTKGFRDRDDDDSDSSQDEVREILIKKAWDQAQEKNNDHLLFGFRGSPVDLSTFHPDPVQIFKLWQVYLDNVNPLLRVVHTPTFQGRLIEAVTDLKNIDSNVEALMFSIYCIAVLSLDEENCQNMFSSSKDDLTTKFQFGCQQALSNCGFLSSSDRNCLTALVLYLVSLKSTTIPQSLSCILGIAIRIAQRMGIHLESALSKCTVLEAETRRRLWWALVLYDTRICEISNSKTGTLDPTWDCKVPLNVNDSDLRAEMKELPKVEAKSTEALFAVVRCELGNFVRYASFHLDFTNPALKLIVSHVQNDNSVGVDDLGALEKAIEEHYLKHCNPDNPLHYMTIWTTRAFIARCRLVEQNVRFTNSMSRPTEAQRETATSHALKFLECDTLVVSSPLTARFWWFSASYFPFPAFVQIVQHLRKKPLGSQARKAWDLMSDNHEAWVKPRFTGFTPDKPFFHFFSKLILQTWEVYEAAPKQAEDIIPTPRIVTSMRSILAASDTYDANNTMEQLNMLTDMGLDEFASPPAMDLGDQTMNYNMGVQPEFPMMIPGMNPAMPAPIPPHPFMNPVHWHGFGRPWYR